MVMEAQINKNRLSFIDVLKGLGIIMVVVGHVSTNQMIVSWLYSFHMPLFFFAAGWVYREKDIFKDLKRRIQTIVIPYFSFGFLVLIYWGLIERRVRYSSMSIFDAIIGLFRGQYDYLDFNVHLWFLPCFFLTVTFYNISKRIVGTRITYIIVVIMSIGFVITTLPQLLWGLNEVFKYVAFYAIGNVLTEKSIDHLIRIQKKTHLIGIAIFCLLVNVILTYFKLTTGIMWFITALIGITVILVVALIIKQNRVLQYFGSISLVILCVHGPIYRVITKIVSIILHISTDAVRANFLLLIVIVVFTIVLCSLVYEMILRVLPWMVGKSVTF